MNAVIMWVGSGQCVAEPHAHWFFGTCELVIEKFSLGMRESQHSRPVTTGCDLGHVPSLAKLSQMR